jgi:hypothetical protein
MSCTRRGCTETVDIHQAKRRGAQLYLRCPKCKRIDPTGIPAQQQIWDEAEWLPGAEVKRPAGVVDRPATEPVTEPATEKPTEQLTEVVTKSGAGNDLDLSDLTEEKTEQAPPQAKRGGVLQFFGVLMVISGILGAAWAAA